MPLLISIIGVALIWHVFILGFLGVSFFKIRLRRLADEDRDRLHRRRGPQENGTDRAEGTAALFC